MRTNVHPLTGHELHWSHLIEEDKRTDHLALAVRQRPAHGKAVTEIAHSRDDDQFERVARLGITVPGPCRVTSSWPILFAFAGNV
jgi:hypothetical protein